MELYGDKCNIMVDLSKNSCNNNLLSGVILTKVIPGVNFNQNLYLVIIYFGKGYINQL